MCALVYMLQADSISSDVAPTPAAPLQIDTGASQLLRVEGAGTGSPFFVEVNEEGETVNKEMLLSDGMYIFFGGVKGSNPIIYVWVGLNVPPDQSNDGILDAIAFLKQVCR